MEVGPIPSMAQLRSVTCHIDSHSVTCYPTQVNTPRLNPSHAGRYSIYLPRRDGRLNWPSWLDSARAGSRTCDLSITSPTPNQCNPQDDITV